MVEEEKDPSGEEAIRLKLKRKAGEEVEAGPGFPAPVLEPQAHYTSRGNEKQQKLVFELIFYTTLTTHHWCQCFCLITDTNPISLNSWDEIRQPGFLVEDECGSWML